MSIIKITYISDKYRINKGHPSDSGFDIKVITPYSLPLILRPGERTILSTGFKITLPTNWEATIRPRSGLAINYGITILNSPGTIDEGYSDVIKIILINLGSQPFTIKDGDRMAQIIFQLKNTFTISESFISPYCSELPIPKYSSRGDNGFGSTGI